MILPEGDEYRIGRPRVYRVYDGYLMYYTRAMRNGPYLAGCAWSPDGFVWQRQDDLLGLTCSTDGCDSRSLAYPVLCDAGELTLMFYNGNEMGREEICLAIWKGNSIEYST